MANMGDTVIVTDKKALAQKAADMVVDELKAVLDAEDSASWVVAGGTSPMEAYAILAENAKDKVDWSRVHFVIGDERCVPFDNPDSNWTQFENAFLGKITQGQDKLDRPQTDRTAEEAADNYEQELTAKLPAGPHGVPELDVVWVGMGPDGHTLSLFPNHPSSVEPSERLVIPVHDSPKPPADRITLTFKALKGTKHLVILSGGEEKAPAVQQALSGDTSLPVAKAAATVIEAGGKVTWLLDEAAASKLSA